MIPDTITRNHILKAIDYINTNGVPNDRKAKKFSLKYDEILYPPKYVISVANLFANEELLVSSSFSGGREANDFLIEKGFEIINMLPIESYSWTILSPYIFVKKMDKSSFLHHGTGIPNNVKHYFLDREIKKGNYEDVILHHNNIDYVAKI